MTEEDLLNRLNEASAIIRDVQPVLEAIQRIMKEEARRGGQHDTETDGELLARVKEFNSKMVAVRPEIPVFHLRPITNVSPGIEPPLNSAYRRPEAKSLGDVENTNPFGVKK